MKDDRFTIIVSLLLGFLEFTFRFGYDIMAFTVESVMYSVKGRCKDCIIDFAGYYGQGVYYVFYTVSCLISPGILHSIGIRNTLLLSVLCFGTYVTSFLYIRNFIYFPAAALAGFGCSLFYLATAAYSAKHSTSATFSRNQGIYWMIARTGVAACGLMMIFTNHSSAGELLGNQTVTTNYRHYSEFELNFLTIGSIIVQILSFFIAFFLPMREITGSIFSQRKVTTMIEQLEAFLKNLFDIDILLLVPFHIFAGMYVAFLLTVYPTTVLFTSDFATYRDLVGYICMALAVGEIAIGLFISLMSCKFKNFGLWPVFLMTLGSFAISVSLLVLFTPEMASIKPTNGKAILGTSLIAALLMGALNGVIDGCQSNVRMVLSATILPSNPAIAFSIARFWQAAASAMFCLVSTRLTVYQLATLLTFSMMTAAIGFSILTRRLRNREMKR
ncbi:unnamed protein product, partial [Mesorhabditis belari]|uniref:Uncharacterized protein n=1 Tax=Mesorhabditis belari TaxID=2138241 RepID=A0AAF3FAQ1_9BILA